MAWSTGTTVDSHCKHVESWVGTVNVVFCSIYNMPTILFNLQKRSLIPYRERGPRQITRCPLWFTVLQTDNALPTLIDWATPIRHLGTHWTGLCFRTVYEHSSAPINNTTILPPIRVYVHVPDRKTDRMHYVCIPGRLNIIGTGQINAMGPPPTQPLTRIKM